MSYLDNLSTLRNNLTPDYVMDALGIRRREPEMTDLIVPVLAAFGVGCAIGAAAGLLLAPKSGEDLRDDLADRGRKLADQAKDVANNARARLGQADGVAQP